MINNINYSIMNNREVQRVQETGGQVRSISTALTRQGQVCLQSTHISVVSSSQNSHTNIIDSILLLFETRFYLIRIKFISIL